MNLIMNSSPFISIIGIIASLAVTVFLCMKVIPAKYDGTFSKKVLQVFHDYFNFKKLYLESILKALFTFLSIACVVCGVLSATVGNIIQLISNIIRAINYRSLDSWVFSHIFPTLFLGLALAVIGPIVLRLIYEGILMFILLVKNVIEINNKMKDKNEDK